MYVVTRKFPDECPVITVEPMPEIIVDSQMAREALEARNLRGAISDIEGTVEENKVWQQIIEDRDSGKPGHYYNRDCMLEGQMPMAAFLLTPLEYGDNPDWWRDDKTFQGYMSRHPEYNWLKR